MNPSNDAFPKGILHPQTGKELFSLTRFQPGSDCGYFVQHYWIVEWDLRNKPSYNQRVLAHPNVNLVFEKNLTKIYGVSVGSYNRLLKGYGWVLGVKFKPGGFYPFWKASVSELTGNSVSFKSIFDIDCKLVEKGIFSQTDRELAVKRVEMFLKERLPEPDPNVKLVSEIVFKIRDDRTIVKVADVVRFSGLHQRTLQRLFARYVGVSPKNVIQRYRMHEAADRMSQGTVPNWSDLSIELGYYDQSHFIRDFKSVLGTSPEEFMRKKA